MTNILVSDVSSTDTTQLIQRLEELENMAVFSPLNILSDSYEEVIPDLVLVNFSQYPDTAFSEVEKILALDQTACIFAITGTPDPELVDHMYKAGIRVVMPLQGKTITEYGVNKLVDDLMASCNDLEHEVCVGCWKTNRFAHLEKLA